MFSRIIKRSLCVGSCLGVLSVFSMGGISSGYAEPAQGAVPSTLSEAVRIGVVSNPRYRVVASSRRATDDELKQANALFYPSIDFQADTGFEYTDSPATRRSERGGDESLWRYNAGLTLTQMLFDGWDARIEVARQESRIHSSAHRVRETAELVGLSITESYLEVLRQRELLVIATKNVADHIAIMNQIEDSVRAGRSTRADLEQARARLSAARSAETNVREALRLAEASYLRSVGDPARDLEMPVVPVGVLSADVETEVVQALTKSPTLDIFLADIDVAEAEFHRTQSTLYPQIDLQLNTRHGHNLSGQRGDHTGASALVVMNWNLYRGGADIARAHEHAHRHLQAKDQRDIVAREIAEDVRQTWARMVAAGERARQFSTQAAANVEVVKAYRDQFILDRRTLLDVLDAQNELFVSRSNTVNAEFLEILAVYRLLALRGDLLANLGVSHPREAHPHIR